MNRQPPVYNPLFKNLHARFAELSSEEDKNREVAKVVIGHVKSLRDNLLPFFAQRDDPREGPRSAEEAIVWIRQSDWRSKTDPADYTFELDFVFRLIRFIVKENPFLGDDTTRLAAAFCKACITRAPEAQTTLEELLAYFKAQGIGGTVEAIDNLCAECNRPLTGKISLFREKRYHADTCFQCRLCRRNLSGTTFTIDRQTDLPVCMDECRLPKHTVQHATLHLNRDTYVEKPLPKVAEAPQPSHATPVHIRSDAWTVEDVIVQLKSAGVVEVEPFRRESIDGLALKALTDQDLRDELGLKLGDRKKVLSLINTL